MQRVWTEVDFDELSWHDNSVHAFRLVEGDHGIGELILDLDHIVEWIEAEKACRFRVAPAELRFHNVTDLRMTLDYSSPTAALTPFTLDGIRCGRTAGDRSRHWTLNINWPVGHISFFATGFTQTLTAEPLVSAKQSLDRIERVQYIATRAIVAHQPMGDHATRTSSANHDVVVRHMG
jgi:hypothetical protein